MNFYAENNNIGLTTGLASIARTMSVSEWISLDIDKHPQEAKPVIGVTPQGPIANVNAFVELEWVTFWRFKIHLSDTVELTDDDGTSVQIYVNYSAISSWAN